MASKEQRELMDQFYDHTGWEFMGKCDVRASNTQGFIDKWNENIEWLHDVACEADQFLNEYRRVHCD